MTFKGRRESGEKKKLPARVPRQGRHFSALIAATAEGKPVGREGNPLAFSAPVYKAWMEVARSLSTRSEECSPTNKQVGAETAGLPRPP